MTRPSMAPKTTAAKRLARGCLALTALLLGSAIAVGQEPEEHLYLLIGQSNMAGRGKVEDQDKVPHPRVFALDEQGQWVPAVDPLHFDKPTIAGVGLGSTFGRAMAEAYPEAIIRLIPCAVGGTPLSRWSKGGDLYEAAVERTKPHLKSGKLKGILWHQGEAECNDQERAESYAKRLDAMIAALREDLDAPDVPFVCGKLGEFLYDQERFPHARTVNDALGAVGERLKNAACVESAGLSCKADNVHFDAAALRDFGKRYAEAMLQLQRKTSR